MALLLEAGSVWMAVQQVAQGQPLGAVWQPQAQMKAEGVVAEATAQLALVQGLAVAVVVVAGAVAAVAAAAGALGLVLALEGVVAAALVLVLAVVGLAAAAGAVVAAAAQGLEVLVGGQEAPLPELGQVAPLPQGPPAEWGSQAAAAPGLAEGQAARQALLRAA